MKQYLVVGLGRFGRSVAKTLYESDESVLVIDKNEEILQEAINSEIMENGIAVDASEVVELKKLGVNTFDVAFVCVGTSIQDSILITLTLKELGIPRIIAKAISEQHGKVLSKVGASEVVYPEDFMGRRVALREIEPNIVEHMKFSEDYILIELKAPEKFIEKNLAQLDVRKKYKFNIIAIKKENGVMEINPMGDSVIKREDMLIIITDTKTAKNLDNI